MKWLLATLGLLLVLLMPFGVVSAEPILQSACDVPDSTLCQESKKTEGSTASNNGLLGADGILTKVTQLILIVVGVVSVIMIIIGGFKYVISSGDPANVKNAKNTILYAIIGIVVAVMAQGIILFVISRL